MTEVKLETSRNGGGNWDTLLASTPNDGSETVTVGGPASQNTLIRVSSLDGTVQRRQRRAVLDLRDGALVDR